MELLWLTEILGKLSDVNLAMFIANNTLAIGLFLAVLKVIAKATPWAGDDEILQIFTSFIGRNKPVSKKK